MNSRQQASAYAYNSRLGKRFLAPAFTVAAILQSGCMESAPGGAQGETQTPSAMRVTAINPNCKIETHLLILDEDAIRNASHCGCSLGHNGEKNGDQNWIADDDDDDDNDNDRNDQHGSNGSNGKSGRGGGEDSYDKIRGRSDALAKGNSNCRNGRDGRLERVTICHIPPGNHNNGHTITVGASAVSAHLAHGDKLGVCADPVPACAANRSGRVGSHGFESPGCEKSAIGKRSTVKFFADNVGREIILPSGSVGDEGWFAPASVRIAWKNAGPEIGDGLRNYFMAGPGLGSPDANGNKESLLDNVPDLVPLRAMGLDRLEGSSVCGVVLDGEVKMSYSPRTGNIQGPNLGKVAFQVLGTEAPGSRSGSPLPNVRVRILDADAVCSDPLAQYANAPAPASMCEPFDVEKPVCSVQKTLLSETWDRFDSTLWRGDGDQAIVDGYFTARNGAGSSAADYIVPCPIPVESSSAVRFTNRVKFLTPSAAAYAQSGALFFLNANNGDNFNDYLFINVGYTSAPSKVFVEMFGSSNGTDFDQFEETALPFATSQSFNLDLWVQPDNYQVAVAEQIIDTVNLPSPIPGVGLFEVGVQVNEDGLRGLVDMTTISKLCKKEKETIQRCRAHTIHRNLRKERMGRTCRNRNTYIRMAKEQIKRCAHPTQAMRLLSRLRETPE